MATANNKSRFKSDIRIKPDGKRAAPEKKARPCARKDCPGDGGYRVTQSRENMGQYIWLCLEHAREHNESWDFFRGMDEKAIESFRNDAITGHRPTWPLGKRTARMHNPHGIRVEKTITGASRAKQSRKDRADPSAH